MNSQPNIFEDGQLQIVATLRDEVIEASLLERERFERLTSALRTYHASGVSIEDLSDASGLPFERVRQMVA